MAVAPVGPDSDMVRYQWDGRVQLLGYNPYAVLPADPSMAHTHTDQTARMPSRRDRTPYPPAAQLFFRLVVMLSDSTLAMKLALVACDLLTIVVLWRWLAATGRAEWLTLAYAWNPLVVFEVAHSGHIDALARALDCRRGVLARQRAGRSWRRIAFVLAIATKLVPIVLAPLFIGRVRTRDVFDAALSSSSCSTCHSCLARTSPSAPCRTSSIASGSTARSSPPSSALTFPRFAAGVALAAGLAVAVWARWRLPVTDPAAWAWPMATAHRLRARHLPLVSALPDAVPVLDRHPAVDGVDRERAVRVQGLGPLPARRPMDHPHIGDGL